MQSTFSVKVEPNLTLNNDVEMNALVPLGSHSSLNIFTALPEAFGLNTWELTASKIHTYNYFCHGSLGLFIAVFRCNDVYKLWHGTLVSGSKENGFLIMRF